MKRAPALATIHAAELRVARSRQDVWDGLRRARFEWRATVVRPSTLMLGAGAIGLLAFWLARRARMPAAVSAADGVGVATTASVAGLLLALAARYGMQGLSFAFQQARAARQLTHDS